MAFAELIVLMLVVWYATFPPSQWASTPNYLFMYLEFLVSNPLQAFLSISTGPTGNISWLALLGYAFMVAHVAVFYAGKRRGAEYIIANWEYLVYMVLLGLFTVSFQNSAQHYSWYWNPATDSPGYVDTWTHIVSAWFIGSLVMPFAFERYLGWERKYFWVAPFVVLFFFSAGWELAENVVLILHPGSFFNTPLNSIQDLVFGTTVAPVLASWIYQYLVMEKKV